MKQKIFICGSMTGLPEYNYPAFFAAEKRLSAAGFEVLNPARSLDGTADAGRADLPWAHYLRLSVRMLTFANKIWLLDGWESSNGAQIETGVASLLKIPLLTLDELMLAEVRALDVGKLFGRAA